MCHTPFFSKEVFAFVLTSLVIGSPSYGNIAWRVTSHGGLLRGDQFIYMKSNFSQSKLSGHFLFLILLN